MPFSGGIFTKVYSWATEQLSPPIEVSKLDTQEADIATGLSNCVLRDGTGIPTADISWNSKKITSLGDASAATDALNRQSADARYITQDGTTGKPSAAVNWNAQQLKNVGNPLFNAQRITSSQSLSSSTVNTLILNSENIDTGAGFDPTTGIFTAPVAGQYVFSFSGLLQNNASGSWTLNGVYFSKNNATAAGASRFDCATGGVSAGAAVNAGSNGFICGGSVVVPLAASDTLRIKVDIGIGGGSGNMALNVGATFSGYMLG